MTTGHPRRSNPGMSEHLAGKKTNRLWTGRRGEGKRKEREGWLTSPSQSRRCDLIFVNSCCFIALLLTTGNESPMMHTLATYVCTKLRIKKEMEDDFATRIRPNGFGFAGATGVSKLPTTRENCQAILAGGGQRLAWRKAWPYNCGTIFSFGLSGFIERLYKSK